jgi:hypothetical protein
MLARNGKVWAFDSMDRVGENGWKLEDGKWVESRSISNLIYAGYIDKVEPSRFGPE